MILNTVAQWMKGISCRALELMITIRNGWGLMAWKSRQKDAYMLNIIEGKHVSYLILLRKKIKANGLASWTTMKAMANSLSWTFMVNYSNIWISQKYFYINDVISVPISFDSVESVISVKENQDVTIPCEVSGFPEPTVHWYFNGLSMMEKLIGKLYE